jgi:hypothetical protein
MDLRFVHGLAERGVRLFVAGDDDQSLYAFRYASPLGIEQHRPPQLASRQRAAPRRSEAFGLSPVRMGAPLR